MKDSHRFWSEVGKMFNNKGADHYPTLKHHITGDEIEGEKAREYVNNYFTEIGEDLHKAHVPDDTEWKKEAKHELDFNGLQDENIMVNKQELIKIIRSMKTYKSSGIEGVRSDVLKDALIHMMSY